MAHNSKQLSLTMSQTQLTRWSFEGTATAGADAAKAVSNRFAATAA